MPHSALKGLYFFEKLFLQPLDSGEADLVFPGNLPHGHHHIVQVKYHLVVLDVEISPGHPWSSHSADELKVELSLDLLDCGWRHTCYLGGVPDGLSSFEVLDDTPVLHSHLVFGLYAGALGLPQFATIPDVLLPSRVEPILAGLPFQFCCCAQDCTHNGQVWVLLPIRGEDGQLFFQEVTVDVVVFEVLDAFQYLITPSSQPGQLTDEDDVNVVVQTEGEGFLEERSILVGQAT